MAQIKKRSDKRRRKLDVHVRLTDNEARVARANASNSGLSTASLMRELAVGHQPRSIIDSKHIIKLIHLRADLGRAGGLLKLWLGEDKNMPRAERIDVNRVLDTIRENQAQLRSAIDLLLKSVK